MAVAAADLLARARTGDKHAIARVLSVVENDSAGAADVVRETFPQTGRALVLGVTGPPGGGKSTLVSRLVGAYRARVSRVAVVAVDPSSPFTGGAILGDRIRMVDRALDEGVFIRSMASRGHVGGLARASVRVVNVLDAIGFDVVLVETVGVGQEEIDVVRVADTVALVTVPGLGDDIQAIKAGILEIADILVVNKGDRPGADETVRDLAQMLTLGSRRYAEDGSGHHRAAGPPHAEPEEHTGWKPPIVRTVAATGEGIDELVAAVDRHREWAARSGERERRRADAARVEVEALLRDALVRRLEERVGAEGVRRAVARVAAREVDPYAAVEELLREA
ncbi:MAG: methylmalonyl Co-A mutase-associated GTPase MeaB [Chloroflexota bacterium]|nr:methylmalonyl Co-A mutase-associated GTPase MeaB [Chloroflexota bacterium]